MADADPNTPNTPAALPAMTPDVQKRLDSNFTYHKPHGTQPERYVQIRQAGKQLAELLVRSCPQSRELSLALTKLEESVFWANAAIARNEREF